VVEIPRLYENYLTRAIEPVRLDRPGEVVLVETRDLDHILGVHSMAVSHHPQGEGGDQAFAGLEDELTLQREARHQIVPSPRDHQACLGPRPFRARLFETVAWLRKRI